MTVDLSGRAAIVTGGAKGIGRAMVQALARAGAVVGAFDIDEAALAGLAKAEAGAGRILPVVCDVADRDAVFAATDRFVGETGGLDILAANAVRFHFAPLVDMPPDIVRQMLTVGFEGAIWSIQAATPHLEARGGGLIATMSSVAVFYGIRNAGVYSAIKGAMDALTRQQAVELGPKNIRVVALAPGPVDTPGSRSVIDDAGFEARRQRTPLGRLATADEIAAALVWLASDAARSITGVTLRIDGGITIAAL